MRRRPNCGVCVSGTQKLLLTAQQKALAFRSSNNTMPLSWKPRPRRAVGGPTRTSLKRAPRPARCAKLRTNLATRRSTAEPFLDAATGNAGFAARESEKASHGTQTMNDVERWTTSARSAKAASTSGTTSRRLTGDATSPKGTDGRSPSSGLHGNWQHQRAFWPPPWSASYSTGG